MILNTYAVLTAFVALLRLLLGVLIVGVGALAWRARGRAVTPEQRTAREDRCALVFLLALLLVGLSLVSWPLLYLLLQSYVPEWPGVMCIYGVTQIGQGTMGSSRSLPGLLRFLQASKPAVVFAGGAWFVLYLLNRRTPTAALMDRLFVVLLPLGALAAVEATAELTYLAIPKKEVLPTAGCCTGGTADPDRFLPPILVGDAGRPWLYAAFYGGSLALVLALDAYLRRLRAGGGSLGLGLLLLGGAIVGAVSGVFLIEVASPRLLGLPFHHCLYDLIPDVPEAVVAIALLLAAGFFLGWAGVARWAGRVRETEPFLRTTVCGLLRLSLWSYVGGLIMLSLELALT
jgi:hypothetical protein